MNYEIFAPPQKTKKHATLIQVRFQKKFRRWELEKEIKDLERKFKLTSKINETESWFELQDKLGVVYMMLMEKVTH